MRDELAHGHARRPGRGAARRWPKLVPDLDLSRVAIRGWSFGGYLAALAVLRRPDVFHAAVAGAPVTDWRLYDTFYTERYLGHPDEAAGGLRPQLAAGRRAAADPAAADHPRPGRRQRGGRRTRCGSRPRCSRPDAPHDVLPLSGVTHMTPQEVVAENLLLLQVEWLRHSASARASR